MKYKIVCFWIYLQGVALAGLEAVSRGAKKAILCDKARQAMQIIQKNIEKTHMQEKVETYQQSFEEALQQIHEKLDIVFLDPPYQTDFAYKSVKIMLEKDLLKEDSILIIETDQEKRVREKIEMLEIKIIDERKYGRANLIFLKPNKGKG